LHSIDLGPTGCLMARCTLAGAVLLLASGLIGVVQARADGGLSVAASGPSIVISPNGFSFSVTVSNQRADGVAAAGVNLRVSFPDVPSLEANNGVTGATCLGDGNGAANCALGDIAAGSSVTVTFAMYTHASGTGRHPFEASSTTPGMQGSGEFDITIEPPPPPPPPSPQTTLTLSLTAAVRIAALTAGNTVTIVNTGSTAATNVSLGATFGSSDVPVPASPPQGTCTANALTHAMQCVFGTIGAGASVSFQLQSQLSPNGGGGLWTSVMADNAPNVQVTASNTFPGRVWLSGSAATYLNGWTIPGTSSGYQLGADGTVLLGGPIGWGSYWISPDGVLHYWDGRTVTVDTNGRLVFTGTPSAGSGPAPAPPPTGGTPTGGTPTGGTPTGGTPTGGTSGGTGEIGAPTGSSAGAPATSPRAVGQPTIAGTPEAGSTLRANPPGWTAKPKRVHYQWQLCKGNGCVNIKGATGRTLNLTKLEAGRKIRVVVTGTIGSATIRTYSSQLDVKGR
jgi:hypothetical protein